MIPAARAVPVDAVRLTPGTFDRRRRRNREYLVSLRDDNLLQNHYLEAGIGDRLWHLQPSSDDPAARGEDRHWGWETPGGQLRGHFLGHWLSAAAREAAATGDGELRARVDEVTAGLERCQEANGGEWVFAIPPAYLDRIAAGRTVWAPQYAIHKTLMGLVDAARDLGSGRALLLATRAGHWFARWSAQFDQEQFDDVLDVETGGMLEVWADLLEMTGDEAFRELLDRYYRRRLFDPLVAGVDVLTNMHANTTIPEVLGAARAFEVTGDARWAEVVHAYWRCAVTERGTFCTGGQTSGEIWTPPLRFAARRGEKNQEHCTVYNMIRLADVLFRWTGDPGYLDHIERNLYNGILAQQHPTTGMVSYFLPLHGGARKSWGTPTEDFWCCHGTLVQAHTRHSSLVFYEDAADALVVAQYIPAVHRTTRDGAAVAVEVELRETGQQGGPESNAGAAGSRHRPQAWDVLVTVTADRDVALPLRLRVPEWVAGTPEIRVDGRVVPQRVEGGLLEVAHTGTRTVVELTLPHRVRAEPIPDEPATVAFVEGPIVLAGLCDGETTLVGDPARPESMLAPDDERHWARWRRRFRTVGQPSSMRLLPLFEVTDEPYSVYFPVVPARGRTDER